MQDRRRVFATKAADPAPIWWRWLRRFLCVIGAFVFLGFLFSIIFSGGSSAPPKSFVLTMHFTGALDEHADRGSFWSEPGQDFYEVLNAIRAGAKDKRAKALVGVIWNGSYSISQIREIRAAIDEWRTAGKPTYAFATSYGDGAAGMASYWLATAFDTIWVQPVGLVTINGMRVEAPYARDFADRNGIRPEFMAFSGFKTIFDSILRRDMSANERTQMTALLNDLTSSFVTDVASARELPEADIRAAIKASPHLAEAALKNKLVDQIGYDDELGARIRLGLRDDKLPFLPLSQYMAHRDAEKYPRNARHIALITIEGDITDAMTRPKEAQSGPGALASSDYCVSCSLLHAGDDKDVAAILLRINSPGGSPSASETIRRAVLVARAKGKPVVVSMGDVVASGGYWIASAADKIVAQPTTLTGSIGVAGGKFSTDKLFAEYGITWDSVGADDTGPDMGSMVAPYTPEAAQRTHDLLAATYAQFKERVAQGRNIKDVETLAQGRVWSGRAAKENGLVDELGGLEQTKTMLSAMLKAPIILVPYMPSQSFVDQLRGSLGIPFVSSMIKQFQAVMSPPLIEARAPITESLTTFR